MAANLTIVDSGEPDDLPSEYAAGPQGADVAMLGGSGGGGSGEDKMKKRISRLEAKIETISENIGTLNKDVSRLDSRFAGFFGMDGKLIWIMLLGLGGVAYLADKIDDDQELAVQLQQNYQLSSDKKLDEYSGEIVELKLFHKDVIHKIDSTVSKWGPVLNEIVDNQNSKP